MEEKQDKNNVINFGNKASEKAKDLGSKVNKKAKLTFERFDFLKYFVDIDKEVSKNEKEKAIELIKVVKDIKDDRIKAETLKEFVKSNNRKEIIEKIIYAVKYLSGPIAVVVVAILMRQKEN